MMSQKILTVAAVCLLSAAGTSQAAAHTCLSAAPGTAGRPSNGELFSPDDVSSRDVARAASNGTIIHSSSGACVRTQWYNGFDACAAPAAAETKTPPPPPILIQAPPPAPRAATLTQEERTVYFGFDKSSLSGEMRGRLDTLAGAMRADSEVTGARVAGYADRIGNTTYHDRLSRRRADAVRDYLVSRGIVNAHVVETRWLGESAPVTSCPQHLKRDELIACLRKDRRVEVEIDFKTAP